MGNGRVKKHAEALSRGRKKLAKAAETKLASNSERIAETILQQTLKGSMSGARLLLDLAEGSLSADAVRRRVKSRAEALAAEPEWQEEN